MDEPLAVSVDKSSLENPAEPIEEDDEDLEIEDGEYTLKLSELSEGWTKADSENDEVWVGKNKQIF